MHVKKGDKVKVIAGKHRVKEPTQGTVLQVFPKQNRIIVEGVTSFLNLSYKRFI